jgi:hypothetical protein
MSSFRALTVEEFRWPSGGSRSAALLDAPPQAVEAACGLAFRAGLDDLDYYRAAGVELASGRRVGLLWRERAAEPHGLELLVDAADEPAAARAEVLAALGLDERCVIWAPDQSPLTLAEIRGERRRWEGQVFVVVRYDESPLDPRGRFAVMNAYWSEEAAAAEVRSANALTRDPDTRYAYESTRLFGDPRSVSRMDAV